MSLLKTNEIQNYNGSSLTLTASTVSTSAQLNTGGNISVTGSLNVSDDSTTRTNLGLGTMATQNANAVAITGGTINTVQPETGQSLTIKDEDGNTAITIGTDNTAAGYLSLNFGSYHGDSGGAGSGTLSANTLSDYEEGSYTATISASTSGTITLKSTANKLEYVKIGQMIFVNGTIEVDSVSSPTGEPDLSLPFLATSAGNYGRQGAGFVGISDLGTDAVNIPITQIIGSANVVKIRDIGFSASPNFAFAAKIDAGTYLNVSLMYKAI